MFSKKKLKIRFSSVIKYGIATIIILFLFFFFFLFPNEVYHFKPFENSEKTELLATLKGPKLKHYYMSFDEEVVPERKRNSQGIVLSDFSYRSDFVYQSGDSTLQPFAMTVAYQAIRTLELFHTKKDSNLYKDFLRHADWLVFNQTSLNDTAGTWLISWAYKKYNTSFNWSGSMIQGLAISALLRAYQATNKDYYMITAEKALNAYYVPISQNGFTYQDEQGYIWYEEYSGDPPPHVLNGFIFSLFGIYEYYRVTGDLKALNIFESGVKTLVKNIHRYDPGYWSAYDLRYANEPCGYYYQHYHIRQLKILYYLTGLKIFKDYSEKFERYLHEPYYSIYKINFIYYGIKRRLTYKGLFQKNKLVR